MPALLAGASETRTTRPISVPSSSLRLVEGDTSTAIPGFSFLPSDAET